ncbi:unnamed protein product [Clonostachys rosea f. rosea IK726]|uniref:aldehyde dehydrogenase (NAD(+)) n=2 Tax=Bionectria ochroleuca TaxID=29856 RepID=A0A0B7KCG1_BIOOC|nr:unnamed protein product [Clonostachys rosea f. rosea IK726]
MWARNEVGTALKFLKGYATLSPLQDETLEDSAERKITTSYVPVGIAVGIVPWNYPIYLASAKIGPALLTGNAFILKASPFTPYTSLKMAELAQRFFPPGVFQALSGDDSLGPMLTSHSNVNMVSFTGSIPTGKAIMKSCSGTLKRVVLELGGNDPAIVCADADPVSAAMRIGLFAFCNSGQICMSIKRIYVHESIYDQFLGVLVQHAGALRVGVGESDFLGPIATEPHFNLLSGIKEARYSVVAGGTERLANKKGFYIPATIIDNPPEDSAIVQEEQFAPVIPVMKWSEESDVIQRANSTDAGLGASVWTRDDEQARRIASQLQAGNVWINTHAEIEPNTPFSGHKQSGLGVEHSVEGLKAYCNVRSIFRKPF